MSSGSGSIVNSFEKLDELKPFSQIQSFKKNTQLRVAGHHYDDMLLLIEGDLRVEFLKTLKLQPLTVSTGPIGEIGFLHGIPATTTVTALNDVQALRLNDSSLSSLEQENPELVALLMRYLAVSAEKRPANGLVQFDNNPFDVRESSVKTVLCRNSSMLTEAQRLRYKVYCEELGRDSPHADHDEKLLGDSLDDFAVVFVAKRFEKIIGTMRINFCDKGELGLLTELYGIKKSPFYPDRCGVCSKLIISPSERGGDAAMSLIAAVTDYGIRQGYQECFIDCVPGLLHYYQAMGFDVVGEQFFHRENGTSIPMKIDLIRYQKRLCEGSKFSNRLKLFLLSRIYKYYNRAINKSK